MLAAKAAVLAAAVTPLALVMSFTSFLLGQALSQSTGASVTLATPGALTVVPCLAGYLVAMTLTGFGLGAVIRHIAGAITAFTGLVLVLPQVTRLFPAPWSNQIQRVLPDITAIVTGQPPTGGEFTPGIELLVCAVWAAVAIAGGLFLITRRDA